MTHYDVVVIGGGVAGLSGATVLARARRTVAVVDNGQPRNAPSTHTHGFLSRDGVSPRELLDLGRAELLGYGAHLLDGLVVEIRRDGETFIVRCGDGSVITARAVLTATGLRDELPAIPGVREHWGTAVLHCPYCHGFEVRDQPLAVIGGDNRAFTVHQASLIRQWSDDVIFFPNGITLSPEERQRLTARGVRIQETGVAALAEQDGRFIGVELVDGEVISRTAVFVGPRFIPCHALLIGLGCAVGEDDWVAVDPSGRTSLPGVWAAGNVVDSPAQLISAAAAGSRAAIAVNHFLLALDIQRDLAHSGLA